jgi:hypothetical protein
VPRACAAPERHRAGGVVILDAFSKFPTPQFGKIGVERCHASIVNARFPTRTTLRPQTKRHTTMTDEHMSTTAIDASASSSPLARAERTGLLQAVDRALPAERWSSVIDEIKATTEDLDKYDSQLRNHTYAATIGTAKRESAKPAECPVHSYNTSLSTLRRASATFGKALVKLGRPGPWLGRGSRLPGSWLFVLSDLTTSI